MLVVSKLAWLIFSSFAGETALAKQAASPKSANSQQSGVLPVRNYSHSAWTDIFYRPKQTRVDGLGLVNEDEVYLTSSNLVSELMRTPAIDLLPVKGVDDGKMVASVLCHHRQSIFYEVQKADHSTVTIFELDILHRPTDAKEVLPFHDAEEAVALACLDHYLLRASKSEVSFIDLKRGVSGKLIEYDDGEHDARFIGSLSVRYAADRAERAEIYAVLPQLQALARLTLHFDSSPCNGCDRIGRSVLLAGGSGSDGPIAKASLREPSSIVASHGQIFFTDGCAVRVISDGVVRTLLGDPTLTTGECATSREESIELAPWASKIAKPVRLVGSHEETSHPMLLLLTKGEHSAAHDASGVSILRLELPDSICASFTSEKQCTADKHKCGWADGGHLKKQKSLGLCFDCSSMRRWEAGEKEWVGPRSHFDGCSLHENRRLGTRYNLANCGCRHQTDSPDGSSTNGWQVLGMLTIVVAGSAGIVYYCLFHSNRVSRTDSTGQYRRPLLDPQSRPDEEDLVAEFQLFVDAQESEGGMLRE